MVGVAGSVAETPGLVKMQHEDFAEARTNRGNDGVIGFDIFLIGELLDGRLD